jgi:hypothetical protein
LAQLLAGHIIQESIEMPFPKQKRITSREFSNDPQSDFLKELRIDVQVSSQPAPKQRYFPSTAFTLVVLL